MARTACEHASAARPTPVQPGPPCARMSRVALAAPTAAADTRPRRTCRRRSAAGAPDCWTIRFITAPGSAASRGGATPSPSGHSLEGLTPGLGTAFHTRQCMDCAGDVRAPAVLLAPETPPEARVARPLPLLPHARPSTLAHAPPAVRLCAGLTRAVACRPSPPRARPGPRSLSPPL